MGRGFAKFRLLMWKNWTLEMRHPKRVILEIVLPVILTSTLVLLRGILKPKPHQGVTYPPFDPLDGIKSRHLGENITILLYSPINPTLKKIMDNTGKKLDKQLLPMGSRREVELYFHDEKKLLDSLGAVCFDDALNGSVKVPQHVYAAIRLPAEMRTNKGSWYNSWKTHLLFPQFQVAGARDPDANHTASPDYYNEGFLAIQAALSSSILEHFSADTPIIKMQRFPYPDWVSDLLLKLLESFVPLIMVMSFNYNAGEIMKSVTLEKEKQLKEAMKIMGLPNWLHWSSWFIMEFIFLFISAILITIMLVKVSFFGSEISVLNFADPIIVFLFFLLYISSLITFCFMASVFFTSASMAAAIGDTAFFVTYLPYAYIEKEYDTTGYITKLVIALGQNSAMALGFNLIMKQEGAGVGVQWSNLFTPTTPDDNMTFGVVLIMLLVDTVLYMLVALYVEAVFPGVYGIAMPWYFPCTSCFRCRNRNDAEDIYEHPNKNNYEQEPSNMRVGIQMRNLQKKFGRKTAVRDATLNMYEDQITILLGHNGAGKTTTMNMLTGVITPTSGTASVGGYNIRTDMGKVRDSLGFCPQHNVLFDDLTVKEHIYFFSKLKGLSEMEVKEEILKYAELLDLVPKMKARSSTLSGGMKRKLGVAIALCGGSKVIMLDEPTAGMDPSARRALWDLMLKSKKGRTILLSTHFMDEADLLGDRIAIMAGGKVQCCGSSFFLKKRYGAGYRLIMDKSESCVPSKVTQLLRQYIPGIEVVSNVGSELSYSLSESYLHVFENMLHDLESNSSSLGIRSYGISLTTLEEVFMKVGADHGQEEENEALAAGGQSDVVPIREIKNHGPGDTTRLQMGDGMMTGCALKMNQILAMLMKKALSSARSWVLLFSQILVPVAMIILTILAERVAGTGKQLPELEISLSAYHKPVTVLSGSGKYKYGYTNLLKEGNYEYKDIGTRSMSVYMFNKTAAEASTVRQHYILGTTFDNDKINAWFNNEPYHSPPLAISMAVNSAVRSKLGTSHSIRLTNYPLPFTLSSKFSQADSSSISRGITFNLGLAMALVVAFYIIFYIKERSTGAKHLQFVSGVNVSIFWCTSFFCDMIIFVIVCMACIITFVVLQEDGLKTAAQLERIFLILFLFGFAALPLQYLGSFFFDVSSNGFTKMLLIGVTMGPLMYLIILMLQLMGEKTQKPAEILAQVSLVSPYYCLCSALSNMYQVYSEFNVCSMVVDSCMEKQHLPSESCWTVACQFSSKCCGEMEDYFAWKSPGIAKNLVAFVAQGIFFFILLLVIEYRIFHKIIYLFGQKSSLAPSISSDEDSDVAEERRKIQNANKATLDSYTLVLKDVTKYYNKKFLAVNGLCLGVKNYECFGLLGVNGAGKTTTFKMMTGDTTISYGDAWINGMSLKKDLKKVQKQIGYCPQFDAVLEDLTGYETMIMYCLLRGIPLSDSKTLAVNLSKDFDFNRHLHKKVKQYSGGNKRKLSTAIALIGNPSIIYLDEPTTGMDPATKRYLWNVLCKVRDSGKCIILTSHSMEECEALCTRMVIMVNGSFKCLGSTQRLKSKFSEGYTLTIKAKRKSEVEALDADVAAIESFVTKTFPNAVLKEKHQEMLSYFVKEKSMTWSRMFGIMEAAKKKLSIEDYSLGQCSLEQVFLQFTKLQREEPV